MSLKIKGYKKIISRAIWGTIIALVAFFLIRVYIFEQIYYADKEGSERSEPIEVIENGAINLELDETEVTENNKNSHVVADGNPRFLTIESLGINKARIYSIGVKSSGELSTPNNIFDVGWYDASSRPGEGGTVLLDGHNGGPSKYGVFKELPSLTIGSLITIQVGGDAEKVYTYKVVENVARSIEVVEGEEKSPANQYMAREAMRSPEEGKESLTIITCAGEWSNRKRTYLERQFVRAVLVE